MRGPAARLLPCAVVAVLVVACGTGTDTDPPEVADDVPGTDTGDDLATDDGDDGDDGDDAGDTTTDGDADADPDSPPPDDDVAGEPDQPQDHDGPLAFSARSLAGGTVEVTEFVGGPVAMWMWTPW